MRYNRNMNKGNFPFWILLPLGMLLVGFGMLVMAFAVGSVAYDETFFFLPRWVSGIVGGALVCAGSYTLLPEVTPVAVRWMVAGAFWALLAIALHWTAFAPGAQLFSVAMTTASNTMADPDPVNTRIVFGALAVFTDVYLLWQGGLFAWQRWKLRH